MTLTPTLKFDPSRGSLVESKNSRLTALWKGLFFFFFFFFPIFRGTLHPSDILKCKFFNVFFPVFEVVQIWLEIFFFFLKYYICVWSRRNIFIPSGKIFLLVYFVNLIFGNIVFFLSLLFFIISPSFRSYWILNFGTEKILFCFFILSCMFFHP